MLSVDNFFATEGYSMREKEKFPAVVLVESKQEQLVGTEHCIVLRTPSSNGLLSLPQ